MNILEMLGLKKAERKVYSTLVKEKKSLPVKDIVKRTSMSERAVRGTIKDLVKKNFVRKELIKSKRWTYLYIALPIRNAWEKFRKSIDKIIGKRR